MRRERGGNGVVGKLDQLPRMAEEREREISSKSRDRNAANELKIEGFQMMIEIANQLL